MSDAEPAPANPCVTSVTLASDDWRQQLIARIEMLRREGKRAMLLVDGATIFVFRADNAGTVRIR